MYPGFVLIMFGKRCRHRNDGRDGSLYAQIPGDRRYTTLHRAPWGSMKLGQKAEVEQRESTGRVFSVVFAGRNG